MFSDPHQIGMNPLSRMSWDYNLSLHYFRGECQMETGKLCLTDNETRSNLEMIFIGGKTNAP